jgi:hypothetical protein
MLTPGLAPRRWHWAGCIRQGPQIMHVTTPTSWLYCSVGSCVLVPALHTAQHNMAGYQGMGQQQQNTHFSSVNHVY